jgi:dTDP-4-dehydrorhamnose 3,5-epimerase-like enzyme
MKKIVLEKVPDTREIDGVKRWEEEKGEFVQISYGEEIRHVAFFVIKSGFWRGMHYHERKDEIFYVIDGEIRAVFRDLDTGEEEEHILTKGSKLRLAPRCWHVFYGITDASVVECSPQMYDKTDTFRLEEDGLRGRN